MLITKEVPTSAEGSLEFRAIEDHGDINIEVRRSCNDDWTLLYFFNAPNGQLLKGYACSVPTHLRQLVECDVDLHFVTE